ncbi:pyruvate kinase [Spartinivicinus ruber]|uniref:pyruvate kinase n=1 Tax=Spartinivicinus ruber TaxID=2683272 RepID=UPI0013D7F87E|nr:pyruvate kinase [Spartinivicinus ruber]
MIRRTKIVATLGPASSDIDTIESMIAAGVNVVRLNFSHGEAQDHINRAQLVREAAARQQAFVAILGDLQGPKIRISRFQNKQIQLNNGDTFILDAKLDKEAGTEERVGIEYKALVVDSKPGDILLLDDGRIELEVTNVTEHEVITKVIIGGPLSNNKGINRQGGGLSAKALTDKDKQDIKTAAKIGVDYVAVSFPRSAEDMEEARQLLKEAGSSAGLIAKIERAEAVNDDDILDGIIKSSEGVMVARGDLGVEIGNAQLVAVQKHIIERARTLNKIAITATQMMESMINNPMPTRAEVSDVANAVLDGTDAVMLSAETAAGQYPIQTIEAVHNVCIGAEKHPLASRSKHRIDEPFKRTDESIALAAMYTANHLQGVKAIIAMTETGATPLIMSRIRSHLPIFAFSRRKDTQNRVALYRGVCTVPFDTEKIDNAAVNQCSIDRLKALEVVEDGDLVIITKGDYANAQGGTNTMKVVKVGNKIL